VACKNYNLKKGSEWTSVCSLYFVGGAKTYNVKDPTIFPWTKEWKDVISKYNDSLAQWNAMEDCKVKPLKLPNKDELPSLSGPSSKGKKTRSSSAIEKLELARNPRVEEVRSFTYFFTKFKVMSLDLDL
jgi:hypothetical protein